MGIDELTRDIEARGLRWDVGMIWHNCWEARIWDWPNVIARKRLPMSRKNTKGMDALRLAYRKIDPTKYPKKK